MKRITRFGVIVTIFLSFCLLASILYYIFSFDKDWSIYLGAEITSQPTVIDGYVYLATQDGDFYRIKERNGKIDWVFRTQDYVFHSPTVLNNVIYLPSFDGYIYALNLDTGKEIWRYAFPNNIQPDSEVYSNGETLFVSSRDGYIRALSPSDGEVIWEYFLDTVDMNTIQQESPLFHTGNIYLTDSNLIVHSSTGTILSLKFTGELQWSKEFPFSWNGIKFFSEKILAVNTKDLLVLDIFTGDSIWQYSLNENVTTTIMHERTLIVRDEKGNIFAIDLDTGLQKWKYSSDLYVNPKLLISNDGKNLFVSANGRGNSGYMLVIDIFDGRQKAIREFSGQIENNVSLVRDGSLLIGVPFDGLYVFDQNLVESKQIQKLSNQITMYDQVDKDDYLLVEKSTNGISELKKGTIHSEKLFWSFTSPSFNFQNSLNTQKSSIVIGSTFSLVKQTAERQIDSYILSRIADTHKGMLSFSQPKRNFLALPKSNLNIPCFFHTSNQFLKPSNVSSSSIIFNEHENTGYIEVTVNYDDSCMKNPWVDHKIYGVFSPDTKNMIRTDIQAFYYEKNTFKLRYSPEIQENTQVDVYKDFFGFKRKIGSINIDKNNVPIRDFLKVDTKSQTSLTHRDGSPFFGIGIQDILWDRNFDGNKIDQWSDWKNANLPKSSTEHVVSMDEFFDFYAQNGNGFNLFRMNIDNASYVLWKDFDNSLFLSREGKYTDQVLTAANERNMSVLMAIFGFTPPYAEKESLSTKEKEALTAYLDYIIARYGVYVDVWQLMNEAHATDEWYTFVGSYLKANDPYAAPISTNWEKPDKDLIDIITPHWYETHSLYDIDKSIVLYFTNLKKWNKPVLFTEVGNKGYNWDEHSFLRFRVRNWLALLTGVHLTYWNTSSTKEYYNENNANIYLGEDEATSLKLVQIFSSKITSDMHFRSYDFPEYGTSMYVLEGNKKSIGYVYTYDETKKPIHIQLPFQNSNNVTQLRVYDPTDGAEVYSEKSTSDLPYIKLFQNQRDLVFEVSVLD